MSREWCTHCAGQPPTHPPDLWSSLGPTGMPSLINRKVPHERSAARLAKEKMINAKHINLPRMAHGEEYRTKNWKTVASKDFAKAKGLI